MTHRKQFYKGARSFHYAITYALQCFSFSVYQVQYIHKN